MGEVYVERLKVGNFSPESPYLPGWTVKIDTAVVGSSEDTEPSGKVQTDSVLIGSYLLPSHGTVEVAFRRVGSFSPPRISLGSVLVGSQNVGSFSRVPSSSGSVLVFPGNAYVGSYSATFEPLLFEYWDGTSWQTYYLTC